MTKFRDVPSHEHGTFLQNAGVWLEAAKAANGAGAYNVAVSNCVHSAINAVDAMTVLRTGKRAASHGDALKLARSFLGGGDRAALERQYGSLLDMKNPAEYEGVIVTAASLPTP